MAFRGVPKTVGKPQLWTYSELFERYRRALLEVPKGNGKTSLAAWIGAYMLATQHSAVIPVAAASFEQAGLLFDDLRTTVAESPTLSRVMVAYENEIQLVDGPGRASRVAAIAGTNDGQRPSTFLATLALEQDYRAGTSRSQFVSPGPKKLPHRVTTTGRA